MNEIDKYRKQTEESTNELFWACDNAICFCNLLIGWGVFALLGTIYLLVRRFY